MRQLPDHRSSSAFIGELGWIFVVFALLHAVAAYILRAPLLDGGLIDTDSYMRLVRVTAFLNDGAWFDGTISRSNAPFGEVLHWTRPLDIMLIALAAPFAAVLDWPAGLHVAALAIAPMAHLAGAVAMRWAVRPILDARGRLIAAFLYLSQPAILSYSVAGRADHHAVLLALFVVVLGFGLRIAEREEPGPLMPAVTLALGIWIAPEFLVPLALYVAVIAASWILRGPDGVARSVAFGGMLVGLLAAAILIERGPQDVLAVEFDRLSIAQFALGLAVFGFLSGLRVASRFSALSCGYESRAAVAAAIGVIGLAILLALFPQLPRGPLAGLPARIVTDFLDHVSEMQPLLGSRHLNATRAIQFGAPAAVGAVYMAWRFWRARAIAPGWLFLVLAGTVYAALTLQQVRWSGYLAILAAVALADLTREAMRLLARFGQARERLWGYGAIVPIACLWPVYASATVDLVSPRSPTRGAAAANGGCSIAEAVRLPALAGGPWTIWTEINTAPELLYRTPHRVIGTPYHRNTTGILDTIDAFKASDPETAHRIATARGVDYMLFCRSDGESWRVKWLADNSPPPAWLEPIALPAALEGRVLLFRIRR